jgi:regulator of sirC expression with transglutaminase-like and TPR domain
VSSFAELAAAPDPPLGSLALALAAEFRDVDAAAVVAALDDLGAELADAAARTAKTPLARAQACAGLLAATHGFAGDSEQYDHPDNSMLDLVLERRRGLPILLSVVYVEVARRAGIPLAGVGLPGHFVVGHFGVTPPLLLDPFAGGGVVDPDVAPSVLRPWSAHEIALRMLNNLVAAYGRRSDLGAAIRGAELRLALPAQAPLREHLEIELRSMRARLN